VQSAPCFSGEITRKYGHGELEEDTINARFYGSAGQSFGAFLVKGVSFSLWRVMPMIIWEKDSQGGKIIVTPPDGSTFQTGRRTL
jgi:glutamate synthase (NADPH) large chain